MEKNRESKEVYGENTLINSKKTDVGATSFLTNKYKYVSEYVSVDIRSLREHIVESSKGFDIPLPSLQLENNKEIYR